MVEAKENDYTKANSTAVLGIRQRLNELEAWTEELCGRLGMTREAREGAVIADRWLIRLRLAWWRDDTRRRFVRMMVRLALASDPTLAPKVREVAHYYTANYAFEWITSEITQQVRGEIAQVILAAGDSSFGDISSAGPMAYVQFHYRSFRLRNVGRFGDISAAASALSFHGEFGNYHDEWRKRLGLDRLRHRREDILRKRALREKTRCEAV